MTMPCSAANNPDDAVPPSLRSAFYPESFKLANYGTFTNSRGEEITLTRAGAVSALARQKADQPKHDAYAIGTADQLRGGDYHAHTLFEAREDGLWAVDACFHDHMHVSARYAIPMLASDSDGQLKISGVLLSSNPLAAQFVAPPWSVSPYGQATQDFGDAFCALSALFESSFPNGPTLAAVRAFEERVRTHLASMRINAEICDGLLASQGLHQ